MPPQANRLLQIPKRANSRGEVNPHSHLTKAQTPPSTTLRPKMPLRSLLTPQIHRLITYRLSFRTRDTSLQPGTDDRLHLYLRTSPRPITSPHHARSSSNLPVRRRRNRDNLRRKPVNNSSYKSRRNPPKSTSTQRFLLLHPQMTPSYFVDPPGAAERGHYRSNREERLPYALLNPTRRPHLRLMNLQCSPPLVHGAKSM